METLIDRAWAEIDLDALEHNYQTIRALLPKNCKLLAPVKADGYGHGAIQIARRLEKLGAEYLAVACLSEGIELRQAGITLPILILGRTDPRYTKQLLQYNMTQAVCCIEDALAYSKIATEYQKTLTVHIKVDTGMTRLGFLYENGTKEHTVTELCQILDYFRGLNCEGIFTHFATADSDEKYTMLQFTRFLDLLNILEEKGHRFLIRHCAASAAVFRYPCTYLDMVRPGIALYGHNPNQSCVEGIKHSVQTVMSLKTRVIAIRTIPANTAVSYGCTHVLSKESRLAVLAIGYGDGLPRGCSDQLCVWVGCGYAPIVGRICMDLCMIDVTEFPTLKVGDTVEIWGKHVAVEAVAELSDTIQYEILSCVSKRVPRVYVDKHNTDIQTYNEPWRN